MGPQLSENLYGITSSLEFIIPELILFVSILLLITLGLIIRRKEAFYIFILSAAGVLTISIFFTVINWEFSSISLFNNMIVTDSFSSYFTILFDLGCLLTLLLSLNSAEIKNINRPSEYVSLILTIALGAHLLVMSVNFIMVFLSLELLSISSYVLAGFGQTKKAAEGSLKYFLFGSVATAVMVYGFSILYGFSGTLDFSSEGFTKLLTVESPLIVIGGLMALAGYFYKIAATPMHLWAPDVYEASPIPVAALFSTVPKLAGIGALAKFTLAINLFGQSQYDWQRVLAIIAIISMVIGNFSALFQNNPKRLMAYSSIAQAGFLLVGLASFSLQGIQFMLFYSAVYTATNFLVFIGLQHFENAGLDSIPAYKGIGKILAFNSVTIFIGLISLAGIPPTGGFTSKLFIFSGLWEAYQTSEKTILLWLLIFGLLNTVVSLFYYLKIPYFAFIKSGRHSIVPQKFGFQNFLALLLVIAILTFFIKPDLLMGWLNKINFVL